MRATALSPLLLLALVACTGGDPAPIDTGEDEDTDVEFVDEDEDGFTTENDCDDANPDVNPGKSEICNEIDDNCDGNIDEGFDNDGDGFWNEQACDFGTDCDDRDDDRYPGAEEVPYDGEDQDCDGVDLCDVDGDGVDAGEGSCGGDDCDDMSDTVFPGAEEIPYDGIDQDCRGGDLIDADMDGHDSEDFGGDDCDDSDPAFNPSRMDWLNDEVDHDCDGSDGRNADFALARAPKVVDGTIDQPGLLGVEMVMCDLDGDGGDDLLYTYPFSNSYRGFAGIFRSLRSNLLTDEMTASDGDIRITGGSTNSFLGMMAACGDIDGDGNMDILLGKGEINFSTFDNDFALLVWYGTGSWSTDISEASADVVWTLDRIPEPGDEGVVYSVPIELMDLDGDGADEVVIPWNASFPGVDADQVWILPGQRYSGEQPLDEVERTTLTMADPADVDGAGLGIHPLPDLDGDGARDWAIGQSAYQLVPEPTEGDPVFEGRVLLFSGLPGEDGTFEDLAYASYLGEPDQYLGWGVVAADVDGSGTPDLILSSARDSLYGGENSGALYVFLDPGATTGAVDPAAEVDTVVTTPAAERYFGWSLLNVPYDVDDDGLDELLVRERRIAFDGTSNDHLHLMGGRFLTGEEVRVRDSHLAYWERQFEAADTFRTVATGDLDGDGLIDLAFSAPLATLGGRTQAGRIYLYLSGDHPWGYTVGFPEEE